MLVFSLALVLSTPASACGGFACDSSAPVVQAGERIVFAVDQQANTVEAHVQISYQGPSQDFAWIVPVPAAPEVFLSTDALFNAIALPTQTTFTPVITSRGDCSQSQGWSGGGRATADTAYDVDYATDSAGVEVVSRTQVGPYDSVVLQATDAQALQTWLVDHGYDLPPTFADVIAPYVAGGQAFLALRLLKDRDTGDLAPIAFRYAGNKASIPIQLTSIAAVPDLPLQVFYLGEHRAVPLNYLHVQINEAAIDWRTNGSNYPAVVSLAADEAGGHAFATDYAGTPDIVPSLFPSGPIDLNHVRNAAGGGNEQGMRALAAELGNGTATSSLFTTLDAYVQFEEGTTAADYWNCWSCYPLPLQEIDWPALIDAVQVNVVDPMLHADAMVHDAPVLTRLTSSLSANEMTVDPIFGENADLPQVSNAHSAELLMLCGGSRVSNNAEAILTLSDGREVRLPSIDWVASQGSTTGAEATASTDVHALVIEQLSESGPPTLLADNTDAAIAQADQYSHDVRRGNAGIGCATLPSSTGFAGLGLLLLAGLRRRR